MRTILGYQDFLNEKSKDPCWKGYKQIGTKKKNGRIVPNCVRVNESSDDNFDRTDFYLNYYKNLSPDGFDVSRSDDSIVISIPQGSSREPIAGLELPLIFR